MSLSFRSSLSDNKPGIFKTEKSNVSALFEQNPQTSQNQTKLLKVEENL